MHKVLVLVALIVVIAIPATASADGPTIRSPSTPPVETTAEPGAGQHDGFFLRLAAGVGYTISTAEVLGVEITYRGGGPHGSVAVGWAVVDNIIVHLTGFFVSMADPTLEVAAVDVETASRLQYGGAGAGMTWYIMPLNLYLSGSLVLTALERQENEDVELDPGFGLEFMIGKEWWMSTNWAIGVAGQLVFASVPTQDANWYTFSGAAMFSATYN